MQLEEESRSIAKENLNRQLIEIRSHKHQNYAKEKIPVVAIESQDNNNNKKSRILIASDSMMNQIDETRLRTKFQVKVCCWGGCNIPVMRDKLHPILENVSYDVIVLHVGTNDSTTRTSQDMLAETIKLKQYIESTSSAKVIISNIIGRTDNGKANFTIRQFNDKLSKLNIPIMDNSNITSKYLGKRGLHLTSPYGAGRLAMNIINLIQGL